MAALPDEAVSEPSHLSGLDGVRGVAIILVLLHHFRLAGLGEIDHPAPLHNPIASYTLMPARMDTLAFGALIAVVAKEPKLLRRLSRWALPAGAAAALSLAILYVWRAGLWYLDQQVQVFGLSALALTFAALLTMLVGGTPGYLQPIFGHRVLTFFGRYSYALYVFHLQIMQQLVDHINNQGGLPVIGGSNLPAALGFTVLATAIAVIAAWLSWHLYEQQFLKLKRFVRYGRSTHALGSA